MPSKTFDEFWKQDSGWYTPEEPQGLAEYTLAKKAWDAALESSKVPKEPAPNNFEEWFNKHGLKEDFYGNYITTMRDCWNAALNQRP
jgi:hypothetical protein